MVLNYLVLQTNSASEEKHKLFRIKFILCSARQKREQLVKKHLRRKEEKTYQKPVNGKLWFLVLDFAEKYNNLMGFYAAILYHFFH